MPLPNLRLRGGTYSWRRKVTVRGVAIPLSLPLRTGSFQKARAIAAQLEASVERMRMGFNEKPVAVDAQTLEEVFKRAMRRQLDRILADQIGSDALVEHHTEANKLYGELWRLHARQGANATWSEAEEARLIGLGWTERECSALATLWSRARDGETTISRNQIDDYLSRLGVAPTTSNVEQIRRVIYGARAEACEEATRRLGRDTADYSAWMPSALADSTPIYDPAPVAEVEVVREPVATPRLPVATAVAVHEAPTLLLANAAENCIYAYVGAGSWDRESVKQVRTAIRLFDYAAGGNAVVEHLTQEHVSELEKLCLALPNRWGRTRAELAGGIEASLKRAEGMEKSLVGISRTTIQKHVTWISQVLEYAASDRGGKHRPATDLSFKEIRKGLGRGSSRERARDKRAAWTMGELARLLSAPIWHGCAGLDDRFSPGPHIWHDAWYWLPLMLILYGGRSAELVALPLGDVYEDDDIPYFRIDYSDLRRLKNAQSIRKLPIHPELIRLGFLEYLVALRDAEQSVLFPEMHSELSKSFASTFYKSVFTAWRTWAFPEGTSWRHQVGGAMKDKDVHSFRGTASNLMKGKVEDSVRFDILGHEGGNTTTRIYDEEADLGTKLEALTFLTRLTESVDRAQVQLRPLGRLKFGTKRGRRVKRQG